MKLTIVSLAIFASGILLAQSWPPAYQPVAKVSFCERRPAKNPEE